jgi:hypothetical protein
MNIEFIPYLGIFLFLITSAIIVAKIIMEMRDETREEIKYLRNDAYLARELTRKLKVEVLELRQKQSSSGLFRRR